MTSSVKGSRLLYTTHEVKKKPSFMPKNLINFFGSLNYSLSLKKKIDYLVSQ